MYVGVLAEVREVSQAASLKERCRQVRNERLASRDALSPCAEIPLWASDLFLSHKELIIASFPIWQNASSKLIINRYHVVSSGVV